MSITVTDVVTQFGAHYKPGSDNQKNLRNMLYKASETAQYFQDRPSDDTIWRGTLAALTRVLQPFQKAFTPLGNLNFKPNQFNLFNLKVDVEEMPDELEATYLGFLTSVDDNDRANWPFVRWYVEKHVLPKKEDDIETNEYFTGVYAAPNTGVAGAAGTAMNGIRKVIKDYNTAGRTNLGNGAISTGAPAANDQDFTQQVETFVDGLPSIFRKKTDIIFMSPENETKYKRGKAKKYGLQVNLLDSKDKFTIEDYPGIRVKGLESMTGSGMLWTSIADNRIRPTKKAKLKDTMKVESAKRVVSLFTNWWEALNFEVPEFIFHNDQDLA